MDWILASHKKPATAYLDDIVIFSPDLGSHLQKFQAVLGALRKAGFTIKPKKCTLGKEELKYFGYIIGRGEIKPQVNKVEAIQNCLQPASKKQVWAFLGNVGYYRRFITNFPMKEAPLTDLLNGMKTAMAKWSSEADLVFQELKLALCKQPVLIAPDFNKEFVIQTNTSKVGIGAVLSQALYEFWLEEDIMSVWARKYKKGSDSTRKYVSYLTSIKESPQVKKNDSAHLHIEWRPPAAIAEAPRPQTDFGRVKGVEHHIPTGDHPPIKERYRPVPPAHYQHAKGMLRDMKEAGVIRDSCSPWAAPLVLVRKKDNTMRMCVDYRKINRITHKDAYPLPRIEESLAALRSANFFSTLDLTSGYWQVPVAEADREKTAFTTPMGLSEFTCMPFGLCNAPGTFQRLMECCLGHRNFETVLLYLDDVIVYSKTYEDHLKHLAEVFEALASYGLKVKPSKCHLLKPKVQYLGHVVSADGVAPDPDKITAIKEWPSPSSVKEVRQFLGLVGYYRRFIPGFTKKAAPMQDLLIGQSRKAKNQKPPFKWEELEEESFCQLKMALTGDEILAYPDYSQPFILYTDASNIGLGAVLSQIQQGKERVIAYASRKLRRTERNPENYSSFKLEFLAVVWAVTERFKHYLSSSRFTVYTDNNPLTHLDTARLGALEQRWMARLSNYEFTIKYRAGRSNTNADALKVKPSKCHLLKPKVQYLGHVVSADGVAPDPDKITAIKEWPSPSSVKEVRQFLGLVGYYRRFIPGFTKKAAPMQDLLIGQSRKAKNQKPPFRWEKLEEESFRQLKMALTGDEILAYPDYSQPFILYTDASNIGLGAILSQIQQGKERVIAYASRKLRPTERNPENYSSFKLEFLAVVWAVTERFRHYLASSRFTVYTDNNPLTHLDTARLGALEQRWMGPAFEAEVFQEFCTLYGCRKIRTTPYHPQTNGLCEKMNQVVIDLLKTLPLEERSLWPEKLPDLVDLYNHIPEAVPVTLPTWWQYLFQNLIF
ncbi:uncharacterized protein [Phyllobates terribilis]|uniref:uncharacterized protein n=1 Tax=Phyllobates terribilis TaxID=111132 RepID=UPI003CCA7803